MPRAAAQPGGMGNFPATSGSLFGKKKEERELSGPSLSATDEPVAEIRIEGNKTIPTTQILNQLQTRVGRPFDPALVQKDVRKLASRGWFVDVQPTYEQVAGVGRVVIFKVSERPIVRYVEYLGNYEVRTKKLAKETGLKEGGPVDPYAVQEAKRRILEYYHRNGYNHAQVSVMEGDKPTDQGIVFVINEGISQKIWEVEFVGNEFLSERRLRTKIDSKPPLMMLFKGYVDREQIDSDVKKLIAFYRSYGFFEATVGRQLVFDEKNKWLTLRFVIHEGTRYQVETVAFIGNRLFSSESLTKGVELKPDPTSRTAVQKVYHYFKPLGAGPMPFEQDRMNADVAWLKELYGSQGFIFADVRAEPIFLEEHGKLKLMYHIDEGKRWRVGNIYVHINGENSHTKTQTVLNRLSFKPGQIADIRELRASERRIQASGLFMNDPVRGVSPKITYQIPEVNDAEMAGRNGRNGFRGQSPDGSVTGSASSHGFPLVEAPGLPEVVKLAEGPPLIAPPTTMPMQVVAGEGGRPRVPATTYKVPVPADFVPGDDTLDVHYYVEADAAEAPMAQAAVAAPAASPSVYAIPPAPTGSPAVQGTASPAGGEAPSVYRPSGGPQVHEVHRPPYEEAATGQSAYGRLVVRTQSPYQPVTEPYQGGVYGQSAASANGATTNYNAAGYGGQAIGATGPDAVPAGTSRYPVRQASITEPQLPPGPSGTAVVPGAVSPTFGPPPAPAAVSQPVAAGPAPVFGPPAVYGPPAGVIMSPAPNITPIPPLPTNPQPLPSTPQDPFTPMLTDPAVDMDVVVSEGQTGRLMLGVAVNSDAGLVGQILLDEQNFDWRRYPTTWEEVVSGRAWRGGGQRFRIEAAPGTEVQRYLVSFTEPYLLNTPVSLGLSGSFFDRRFRDWDEQRLGGRVSLGYQWVENDLSTALSYRGEDIEISNIGAPGTNIPELEEVRGNNALHGFKWTLANDTRDSAFLATEGHFLQLELEQVIGSFSYPRAVLDARQYLLISERADHSGRHVVTASTRLGFTGSNTPIYDNFFAGGFSTMRGFEFRGASPVRLPEHIQVGGEFEWLNTLEYLFPISADDMIHGVAFVDFGTVEEKIEIRHMRVAPGFGLRITVPAMGPAPIALDFAFPVVKSDTDETQVFSFNIGLQR